MYENAQYVVPMFSKTPSGIKVDIGGISSFVPIDPDNTDYQKIMQLVAEGKLVIQPAE